MRVLLQLLRRHRTAPYPAERFTLDRGAALDRLARLDGSSDESPLLEPTDAEVAAAARFLLALLDGVDRDSEARELADARELVEVAVACLLSSFVQIESDVVRARFSVGSGRTIGELVDAITALGGDIDHDTLSLLTTRASSGDIAALAVRRLFADGPHWFVRRKTPSLFSRIARRLFGERFEQRH